MGNMKQIIVFENENWSIDLRPRNNTHAGEPDMKVWVCTMGQEVAQYSNKYRGYGYYKDNEALIPENISSAAKAAWEKLKAEPFNDDVLAAMKAEVKDIVENTPVSAAESAAE
ncbi:MAG: hypothetical protein K6E10_04175 [Eubacterium sp.]|nr:hypothetical protein [Eubacterium sp.]